MKYTTAGFSIFNSAISCTITCDFIVKMAGSTTSVFISSIDLFEI